MAEVVYIEDFKKPTKKPYIAIPLQDIIETVIDLTLEFEKEVDANSLKAAMAILMGRLKQDYDKIDIYL